MREPADAPVVGVIEGGHFGSSGMAMSELYAHVSAPVAHGLLGESTRKSVQALPVRHRSTTNDTNLAEAALQRMKS